MAQPQSEADPRMPPELINHPSVRQVFHFLSAMAARAYRWPLLVCNVVLSKGPFSGGLLDPGPRRPFKAMEVLARLGRYLRLSLRWWFRYVAMARACARSGAAAPAISVDRLVVIDTYFLLGRLRTQGCFRDIYFPGLTRFLERKGQAYVYAPRFYGMDNPANLGRDLAMLARQGVPALTEWQALRAADYLRLLGFILAYPLAVLGLMARLDPDEPRERALRQALAGSLDQVAAVNYSRYLFGRRLARLPADSIKCISWYENQAYDQCFYRGLHSRPGKVEIYGAQLFVWPPSILNIHPDEALAGFGVLPDHVVVNGPYYLPRRSRLDYRVGPSLRSSDLFSVEPDPGHGSGALLALSNVDFESRNCLEMVAGLDWSEMELRIRLHPSASPKAYRDLMPPRFTPSTGDLYGEITGSAVVMGSESSVLVEAICLGVPVLYLDNARRLSHNPLPAFGQGEMWLSTSSAGDIPALLDRLASFTREQPERAREIARWYRANLYTPPGDQALAAAFDLFPPA